MNLGLRALLYTARKWKKTLLVFCLILSISTLVLSGLAIADAQEEQSEELRGVTGASFTVERNLSTGGWASGNGGSYSTQEFITDEMLQEIASVDGVAGYDAALVAMPNYYNEKGKIILNKRSAELYDIKVSRNQIAYAKKASTVDGNVITSDNLYNKWKKEWIIY